MTKEGLSPDIDSYCLLTQAAVAAKDRDAAERAFGEVRRRVSALSDGQGEELGERGGGGGARRRKRWWWWWWRRRKVYSKQKR